MADSRKKETQDLEEEILKEVSGGDEGGLSQFPPPKPKPAPKPIPHTPVSPGPYGHQG